MTNLTIRNIDENVFREFKSETVKENINLGETVTIALKFWVENKKERERKMSFLELKHENWGKETRKTSKKIDKILYGK